MITDVDGVVWITFMELLKMVDDEQVATAAERLMEAIIPMTVKDGIRYYRLFELADHFDFGRICPICRNPLTYRVQTFCCAKCRIQAHQLQVEPAAIVGLGLPEIRVPISNGILQRLCKLGSARHIDLPTMVRYALSEGAETIEGEPCLFRHS